MATTAQHIAARNDTDLLARLVAAAEMAGVPAAQQWTEAHRGALVAADIGGTTIADVHAYAVSQQLRGFRTAAVTDAQLTTAVQAVHV